MRKMRWLPASMLALGLSVQAAWGQYTPTSPVVANPQVSQPGTSGAGPRTVTLPQVNLAIDEGRDPQEVNQVRVVREEEQDWVASPVAECLHNWGRLWREGKYQEARMHAEKAVKLDPTNVAAQHARMLTGLVSKFTLTGACESTCAEMTGAAVARVEKPNACCQQMARMLCLPPNCMDIFSFLKPMVGCGSSACAQGLCAEGCCSDAKPTVTRLPRPRVMMVDPTTCCDCPDVAIKVIRRVNVSQDSPGNAQRPEGCCADVINGRLASADACCKAGKCACGNCPCTMADKSKAPRAMLFFPHLLPPIHPGQTHPPMVISGFGPLQPPVMPHGAWGGAFPGAPRPSPWVEQHRVVSRGGGDEPQSAYQINATGNEVHIRTPHLDAQCQRMTCLGTRDRVLLEGNVRLSCRKDGQVTRIEAPRVLVDLLHGTFTVESGNGPTARPVSLGNGPVDEHFHGVRPTNFAPPLPYSER